MILNFFNSLILVMVLVTTGCVVGDIKAPVDESGATVGPSISSVSPTSGPLAGSTSITLTGSAFSTGMGVSVGGATCAPVTVSSSTSATCTTTANTAGAKDIIVTDSDGNSDTLFSGFTYRAAPTVTGVNKSTGSTAGGTLITVSGTNFFSGASVTINSVACSGVSVASTTSLSCTTGASTGGPYAIVVTNDDGQSGSGSSFTYAAPPTVSTVTPNFGAIAGGTSITITGSNFTNPAAITINGVICGSFAFTNSSTISCTTGDNSGSGVGTYNVVVTNSNLVEGTLSSGYTYLGPPTVSSISPSAGNHTPSGGAATDNDVVITGTNFVTGATVFFDLNGNGTLDGGEACSGLTVDSATQISCDRPDSGTTGNVPVNVYVTNVDGQRSVAATFTYQDPPAITTTAATNSLAVAGGTNGGAVLTITGTNFISPSVVVGSTACTISTSSATSITCTTGTGSLGAANVVVTNSDGQSATDTGAFTYQAIPTLTNISPSGGNQAGGTTVTFTGTNFTGVSGIKAYFGSTECTGYSAIGATSFTCNTPAGTVDTTVDVKVVIQDAAEQTATLTGAYTYQAAPTLTAVSPNIGGHDPTSAAVTLTGTNFRTGATAFFDLNGNTTYDAGEECSALSVVSSTQITCNRPDSGAAPAAITAGTAGTLAVNVYVVNSDNQSASLTNGHTYQDLPTLSAISKNGGSNLGGYTITLTGTNFRTGVGVTIGGQTCLIAGTPTTTSATCTPPSGMTLGQYDVVLTNTDGQSATLSNGFTFQAAPTITSISPPGGPLDGSLSFTITGTGFAAADTPVARVGTTACDTTTVVNSTTITCDPPSFGIEAVRDVSVELNDGDNQSVTLASSYRYANAPTVTDIVPFGGSIFGGTAVTITGTNFQDGATVAIGGQPCNGVTFVSTTELTCTTSSNAAGSANVVVTNPDTQPSTVVDVFIYSNPPSISNVSPDNGTINGGSTITITGTNFDFPGATAYINNVACDTGSSVVSATSISCVVPVGTGATANTPVDVKVVNSDGQQIIEANRFTYVNEPTITNITPGIGPSSGVDANGDPVTITITGTNFDTVRGITSITLNGSSCSVIAPFTATEVSCTLQSGTAGNGDVVLTNNDGDPTTATLSNGFTYIDAPTITSINGSATPISGPAEGGTTLNFIGTGFHPGLTTTISIGSLGTCDSVNVTSATTLSCVTSAGVVGTADVTLTNFDGQKATFTSFTYQPGPTITSISPQSGSTVGGSSLTITGTNFKYFGVTDPTVTVGGNPCTVTSFPATNTVICTVPPGTAGFADVVLTNPAPDGQSNTLSNTFTFVAPPTITSVSPSVVATGTTTAITVNGTNFYDEGAGVSVVIDPGVGNYTCSSPTVVSSTQITCTAPASIPAGSYAIRVTNDDGSSQQVTSGASTISAVAPPTIISVSANSGVLAGGETITITGTGFTSTPTPEVTVGGQACTSVNATGAPTTLTCVTPASTNPTATTASTVDTSVRIYPSATPAISSSTAGTTDDFTYNPLPVVTSALNAFGNAFGDDDGGQTITITGNNFVATPSAVTIGGVPCTGVTFSSTTQITCTSGANSTTDVALDVVVTNPDGQSGTGASLFTYLDPPTISGVSPSGGINTGGETITITGSQFTDSATVTIGGSTCGSVSITGDNTITCTSPVFAPPTASHNVVVTNKDGQIATSVNAWQSQIKPTLTSVSPDNGNESGGTTVTVTGTNFESGTKVRFGTSLVDYDSLTGTTSMTVTAPAGSPSTTVNVTIQNPTGQTSSETVTYTFNPASPEIEWQVGASSPNPPNPATYSSTPVATNQSQTFTLRNVGSVQTGSLTITVTGTNSGAFFINSDTCSGSQLNPYATSSEECTVDVVFLGSIVTDGVSYTATLNATDGTTTSTNGLEANP